MHVKFLEKGLVVLQVASTSTEKQDTHENILVVLKVGACFDVFDMGMLENTKTGKNSVQQAMYNVQTCMYTV